MLQVCVCVCVDLLSDCVVKNVSNIAGIITNGDRGASAFRFDGVF